MSESTDSDTIGTEWIIHRFECPDCGATSRADRFVGCYRCGSEMEQVEKIGVVTDTE